MEIQIKKAVKAGNSSAVILPRSWLNKEVRIELIKKTPDTILLDVLQIIKEHISLEEVIGIYLAGSYARNEEDQNSDIDILVITSNIDKEMISHENYNILIVSSKLLEQKLKKDLLPIGQMIKEAKPLLNANYLDSIEVKITKENISWYLKTTEEKLQIIKEFIDKTKTTKKVDSKIIYTLVLRIRTLYIIKKLMNNEIYSKNEFIKIIKGISGETKAYETYLDVKNNIKTSSKSNLKEVEKLYSYLEDQLKEIKRKI